MGEEGHHGKYGKWVLLRAGGGREQARKGTKQGHLEEGDGGVCVWWWGGGKVVNKREGTAMGHSGGRG